MYLSRPFLAYLIDDIVHFVMAKWVNTYNLSYYYYGIVWTYCATFENKSPSKTSKIDQRDVDICPSYTLIVKKGM